jgi:FeS assembly protein IscX
MYWRNKNQIVEALHQTHYGKDVSKDDIHSMTLHDLHHLIINLDEFEDNVEKEDHKELYSILNIWKELVHS